MYEDKLNLQARLKRKAGQERENTQTFLTHPISQLQPKGIVTVSLTGRRKWNALPFAVQLVIPVTAV